MAVCETSSWVYIYIYRERERERESQVIGDQIRGTHMNCIIINGN